MSDVDVKEKDLGTVLQNLSELKQKMEQKTNSDQQLENNLNKCADDIVEMQKSLNTLNAQAARNTLSPAVQEQNDREEASKALKTKMLNRSDLAQVELVSKSITSTSQPSGGFLVIPEIDNIIGKIAFDSSPIVRLATQKTINGSVYKKFVRDNLPQEEKYKIEGAANSQKATPTYKEIEIKLGSLGGNYQISQEMLEDTAFDVVGDLTESIQDDFALSYNRDLVTADGSKGARGLFAYPKLPHVANTRGYEFNKIETYKSGASAGFTIEGLTEVVMGLNAPHRQGAVWLMNSFAYKEILLLKSANNYHFLRMQPSDGLQGAIPLGLLGYPVEFAEDLPVDFNSSGSLVAGFGNVQKAYTVVKKPGLSFQRDATTDFPNTLFKYAQRCGGGITNFQAFKYIEVGA